MSLKSVSEKLLEIKQTSSTNAKISLLSKSLLNDEVFKHVIKLMYNDDLHYKVNKLPPFSPVKGAFSAKPSNEKLFNFLEKLAEQKGASNADKLNLARLASMDKESFEVVKRIVNKDAKCGFGGKTINKAYPDLLFLMPYCRCSTAKKKMSNIDYKTGAVGQEKADGMFANIIIDTDGGVLFRSRNGNIVHQLDHLKDFFHRTPKEYRDTVYMGEFLICIGGKILPRKTGNGILNSCLQNAADQDKAKHAIVKLWDAVPQKQFWAGSSEIAYKYRLGRTSKFVKEMKMIQLFDKGNDSFLVDLIQSKMLHSLEEAQSFYKGLRLQGKEGAIVKNIHAKWKDHTSPNQVKMKACKDAELRIISWRKGKEDTKWANCMGSVQLESEDGLIQVSISGFTDKEHYDDWNAKIGKVVTIEYDGIITDKSRPGVYSLYLPRNLEMRPERTYADTYKDLKNR